MRWTMFVMISISLGPAVQAVPQPLPQTTAPQAPAAQPEAGARQIPCKVPENASMCYWTRGRLQQYQGGGSWRMWKVGTKRILWVVNGPSKFPPRTQEEVHNPEFPPNLERAFLSEVPRLDRLHQFMFDPVYADFEICPLEPDTPGASQAICIESAKNIFFDGSKRLYP